MIIINCMKKQNNNHNILTREAIIKNKNLMNKIQQMNLSKNNKKIILIITIYKMIIMKT